MSLQLTAQTVIALLSSFDDAGLAELCRAATNELANRLTGAKSSKPTKGPTKGPTLTKAGVPRKVNGFGTYRQNVWHQHVFEHMKTNGWTEFTWERKGMVTKQMPQSAEYERDGEAVHAYEDGEFAGTVPTSVHAQAYGKMLKEENDEIWTDFEESYVPPTEEELEEKRAEKERKEEEKVKAKAEKEALIAQQMEEKKRSSSARRSRSLSRSSSNSSLMSLSQRDATKVVPFDLKGKEWAVWVGPKNVQYMRNKEGELRGVRADPDSGEPRRTKTVVGYIHPNSTEIHKEAYVAPALDEFSDDESSNSNSNAVSI